MVVTSQDNHVPPVPSPADPTGMAATTAGPHGGRLKSRWHERAAKPSPARRNDGRLAWVLIAPAVVGFLVFYAYPTVRGIYLSFTDFHVLTPPKWVGLANFRELLHDDVFWHSLGVTVYFVILSVVLGTLVSLMTAVIMHRLSASTVIRGMIMLPFLISNVVAALVWSWMLDPQLGIINIVIEKLTGQSIMFFGSGGWAIPSLAAIMVWKYLGYYALLIFAGLQTIPPTIYEAGRADGASELQMFRRLTIPLLRPILVMVVILTVINAFQVFDIIEVTTKGGPANASNVLQMYIYDKAFSQFDFGYAATMSLALLALLIAVTFTQMRLARADESDLS